MNIDDEIKKLELQKDHLLAVIKEAKVRVNNIAATVRRLERIKKDVIDTVGQVATPSVEVKAEDKEFKDPAQLEIEEPIEHVATNENTVLVDAPIDAESY